MSKIVKNLVFQSKSFRVGPKLVKIIILREIFVKTLILKKVFVIILV